MVPGVVDGEDAVLVRPGDGLFAVGGLCTHYHAKLCDGLLTRHRIALPDAPRAVRRRAPAKRCARRPWMRCRCWRVERVGDVVMVRERVATPAARTRGLQDRTNGWSSSVAARQVWPRPRCCGAKATRPVDDDQRRRRSAVSTGRICRRTFSPATRRPIGCRCGRRSGTPSSRSSWCLGRASRSIDAGAALVGLPTAPARPFGALLLATGADAGRSPCRGRHQARCTTCAASTTAEAIVARARRHRRALVIGASFIGLEVAASLRARGIEVHVVAPEAVPLQRVLGPELGRLRPRSA